MCKHARASKHMFSAPLRLSGWSCHSKACQIDFFEFYVFLVNPVVVAHEITIFWDPSKA